MEKCKDLDAMCASITFRNPNKLQNNIAHLVSSCTLSQFHCCLLTDVNIDFSVDACMVFVHLLHL